MQTETEMEDPGAASTTHFDAQSSPIFLPHTASTCSILQLQHLQGESDEAWQLRIVNDMRSSIAMMTAQPATATSTMIKLSGAGLLPHPAGRHPYLGGRDLGIGKGRAWRSMLNSTGANSVITVCGADASCAALIRIPAWKRGLHAASRGGTRLPRSAGCARCSPAQLRVRRHANAQMQIIAGVINGDFVLVEKPSDLSQTVAVKYSTERSGGLLQAALNDAIRCARRARGAPLPPRL